MSRTLKKALKEDKLDKFIKEQEAKHPPAEQSRFKKLLNAMTRRPSQ